MVADKAPSSSQDFAFGLVRRYLPGWAAFVRSKSFLAGIGNLYKAEMLFLRGINPWQPTGAAGDLSPLVELARQLLDANKERFSQVTTGNPARGQETWVYGRSGRPCRRCRTPIKSDGYAGTGTITMERITFWCPSCQS